MLFTRFALESYSDRHSNLYDYLKKKNLFRGAVWNKKESAHLFFRTFNLEDSNHLKRNRALFVKILFIKKIRCMSGLFGTLFNEEASCSIFIDSSVELDNYNFLLIIKIFPQLKMLKINFHSILFHSSVCIKWFLLTFHL